MYNNTIVLLIYSSRGYVFYLNYECKVSHSLPLISGFLKILFEGLTIKFVMFLKIHGSIGE